MRDVYQAGRIAYQTDGGGTTLATFTYDSNGIPTSVQVGSDPTTAPRYFYVYNGHGDVVALTDAAGNTVATYSYDVFGGVTASETLPGGWSNPYRYDGKDRVRYDSETSLYWMSVRAYDPTLGRFLSRDPLRRSPLFGPSTQPYVYGDNNPLTNVDPSGQRFVESVFNPSSGAFVPSKPASTSVASTSGSSGGSGDPTAEGTDSPWSEAQLERGQKWLDFLAGLVVAIGGASLKEDWMNLVENVPTMIGSFGEVVAGDAMEWR